MDATTENRGSQRRSTMRGGEVVFNAGRTRMPCIVRDISGRGARIELKNSTLVPDSFDLVLPNTLRQPCKVAWRRGREIGASFT